jgi:hypothetical protein
VTNGEVAHSVAVILFFAVFRPKNACQAPERANHLLSNNLHVAR